MIRNFSEATFTGSVEAVRIWCILGIRSLLPVFSIVMIFVVLRLIVRRQAVAIGIGAALIFAWWSSFAGAPVSWLEIATEALIVALFTFVTIRFGLLSSTVAYFVFSVCQVVPLTLDVTHWSAGPSNQTLAMIAVMTVLAFAARDERIRN